MITWIRENAPLASLLGAAIAVISTVAVGYHQLSSVVASQSECEKHRNDSTRHLDPQRDPERLKRLEEEIKELKEELRRMQRFRDWQERRRER